MCEIRDTFHTILRTPALHQQLNKLGRAVAGEALFPRLSGKINDELLCRQAADFFDRTTDRSLDLERKDDELDLARGYMRALRLNTERLAESKESLQSAAAPAAFALASTLVDSTSDVFTWGAQLRDLRGQLPLGLGRASVLEAMQQTEFNIVLVRYLGLAAERRCRSLRELAGEPRFV